MSKSSTASAPKIPTQLPPKSAWSRGPPQASTAPSPRSQSPAPSNPQPTHSRRPSALGQGVPIKDGVSIPRSNVGAAKQQSSAVSFGSIDDVAAPISSSPAAAPPIKSEGVKSFGSITAGSVAPSGHVNGKPSISSRFNAAPPAASSSSSSSSSPAPAPPAAPLSKPAKMDIHKLFQNNPSSAPAPSSAAETSSPSMRNANLPSQPSAPPQIQPPPLGSHGYTPFVPGSQIRPQQQNGTQGGGRPPGSPSYPRQMPNGNGPRSQGGPNGGPSAGLASPRLGQHPHNPQQPSGMPPQQQMQPPMPGMPQQMPVPGWPGYYYDQPYMQYPGWGYPMQQMAPPPHPQSHQHPPPPPGQHGPPHMPMSPRNHPLPLQVPGTPTLSHAVPQTPHVQHNPPPLSHTSSGISSLSSPPPTPSSSSTPTSARLNANSSTFVPTSRKIVIKKPDGTVVENLASNHTPSPSMSTGALPSQGGSVYRQGSPGTPNRRPMSVRMETEEQRSKRIQEEEAKEKELLRAKEEEERKKREEQEEKERKVKEEEEKKKREEEERIKKEAEEKERKIREEEERVRKEKEEAERKVREEEERKKAEEEELKRIEEELKLQKAKEEAEKERLRLEAEEQEKEKERIRLEEEAAAAAASASASTTVSSGVATPEPEAKPESVAEEGEVAEQAKDEGEVDDSAKDEAKDKVKEPLRINTAAPSAVENLRKQRPGPLDLSNTRSVPSPLPSALATARAIDDLGNVPYPEGVLSPKPELNKDVKDGKFRYDRDFLLQFMQICKEKPDMLPPLDAIGLEPVEQSSLQMGRGGSGRHRQGSNATVPRQASVGNFGQGGAGFGKPSAGSFTMGNFATGLAGKSSEERFAISSGRSISVGSVPGQAFGRPTPMQRTPSQGGPGGPMASNRTRSKRGEKRGENNKAPSTQHSHGSGFQPFQSAQQANLEPVAPLQFSQNRWDRKAIQVDSDSPEMVDRKVKGLLNKLTMEKFDSISDQIIAWANKSENEKDGRTLIQVIRLVFEKATDEAAWSEMYARLCRKMMEQVSANVQDDGIKNSEGKPITGGQLFRKYLLNRCQEDFERGWVAKEATAAAAATKVMEDEAAKAANEKSKEGGSEEIVLYSDEYYAAQKAKRQGLGLIKFIGELFKLQMLTERIMHECVKKLLGNVENPEEEEIESLCKLLSTVGQILDTPKARAHMDVYFSRMKELTKSQNVSSRMQFMLQDVIELRDRKWMTRNVVAAPATLAQIHETAAKEKANADKESYNRQVSMSRGGSRRGGDRSEFPQVGPDGWAVAGGGSSAPRPPPKAGDLTNFGKISKAQPMTFGPGSVFAGKKGEKRESITRTSSSSNMFSMLSQGADTAEPKAAEAPTQRKKLVLQPRSKPVEDTNANGEGHADADAESEDGGSEGEAAAPEMSEADVKKKIAEDLKEFFAVRNLEEAEVYFTSLPSQHHTTLVDKLVSFAVESKEADAQLVADFFAVASSKELCSPSAFEEGLIPIAEIIEDIAIDAPKAYQLFAMMVKGAGLDEEGRARVAAKSEDSDKLLALLS